MPKKKQQKKFKLSSVPDRNMSCGNWHGTSSWRQSIKNSALS